MKVSLIYNESTIDPQDVINIFGMTTKEHYSKKVIEKLSKDEKNYKLRTTSIVTQGIPSVVEEESNKKSYNIVKDLAKKHEIKIKRHEQLMSSDISNVPSRLSALDGFGPIGHNYHSTQEYILHDSIVERSVLLASVIYRCGEK